MQRNMKRNNAKRLSKPNVKLERRLKERKLASLKRQPKRREGARSWRNWLTDAVRQGLIMRLGGRSSWLGENLMETRNLRFTTFPGQYSRKNSTS